MKLLKQCSLDGVTRENEIWKDVKHYLKGCIKYLT